MPNTTSLVTVKLDGLFLFVDQPPRDTDSEIPCRARICTVADDHDLKIVIDQTGGPVPYGPYTIQQLKDWKTISLRIEDTPNNMLPTAVRDAGDYDFILPVTRLYANPVLNESSYGASLNIHQGRIGSYTINSKCRQVQLDRFDDVDFYITDAEWENKIIDKKARYGADIIKNPGEPFARAVRVLLELEVGQRLRLFSEIDGFNLIDPLEGIPGKNYFVTIKFSDSNGAPVNLRDCMGIGHHSMAIKPAGDVVWTFFRPTRIPEESISGCCEAVRM